MFTLITCGIFRLFTALCNCVMFLALIQGIDVPIGDILFIIAMNMLYFTWASPYNRGTVGRKKK